MNRRFAVISMFVMCALLALAPLARAQSPTLQGYGEDRGIVQQVQHASTSPQAPQPQVTKASTSSSGAKLPFTGLDLAIVVALGSVLAGTGFVLRRSARS